MMQTVSSLKAVKGWLEQVLEGVTYQQPFADGKLEDYQLTQPAVYLGWIPPGAVLEPTERVRLPCLVVGLNGVETDAESTTFDLQITVVVYDPGHQSYSEDASGPQLDLTPNFDGYSTLLNLLDLVRMRLLRTQFVADRLERLGGVTLKTYEEQPYPYWYGYLKCQLVAEGYPQTDFAEIMA